MVGLESEMYLRLKLVLARKVRTKYFAWCRRLCWSEPKIQDWAEDVVSEGIALGVLEQEKFDSAQGSLEYWLWMKVLTVARDSLVKTEHEAEAVEHLVREYDFESHAPIEAVLLVSETNCLLRELKPEYREALVLYYCGFEVRTIARLMRYEPKTIYTLLDRGRKRLRELNDKIEKQEKQLSTDRAAQSGAIRPPPPGEIEAVRSQMGVEGASHERF